MVQIPTGQHQATPLLKSTTTKPEALRASMGSTQARWVSSNKRMAALRRTTIAKPMQTLQAMIHRESWLWGLQNTISWLAQAHWVLQHLTGPNDNGIIWIDIEPGNNLSNGWNSEGNSCGGKTGTSPISAAVDRSTFNGFFDTIANAGYTVGVYSFSSYWSYTFGSDGSIPNTLEWTYESDIPTNPAPALGGWCGSAGCAEFFGGQSAGDTHAIAWQWSQSGGDFDTTYWGAPQ